MAYSPIDQARLVKNPVVRRVAERRGVTPAQVALAWVLARDGVMAIPKGGNLDHVKENRAAHDLDLTPEDLRELDRGFPPPAKKVPLEML